MKSIRTQFPNSPQRTSSDPFPQRNYQLNESCAEKLARSSKQQKQRGANSREYLKFFHAIFFKRTIYPFAFHWAINALFVIPVRREIINWTEVALKNWLENRKSKKKTAAHPFCNFCYFSFRCFQIKSIRTQFPNSPQRTFSDPFP